MADTPQPAQLQLHLIHPYNVEIKHNAKVQRYLRDGFRITELQRVTDREVVVTLAAGAA